MAAVVSLPSLAASAILSLPSPGAVGALPDATVSLSTPMERSTGGEEGEVGKREGGEEEEGPQPAVSIIHSLETTSGSRVGSEVMEG